MKPVASSPFIVVFDNFDSFTFNLVHYVAELGAEIKVIRSDELSPSEFAGLGADGFLISPGPGRPAEAGYSKELVSYCIGARSPLLGVCLGHQCIGELFGATVEGYGRVMHGKSSAIEHDGTGVFRNLPAPFQATRYHSLVVNPATLGHDLIVNATAEDGTVQGIRHRSLPVHGVQFHPESVTSEHGHALLRNFLEITTASGRYS